MLLCIDIGNTNIVVGIFQKNKLLKKWRVSTNEKKTEDEYANILTCFLQNNKISHCILSSVVPNLNSTFKKLIIKYFHIEPLIVTNQLKLNITLKYPNPDEIGADRIVNAVAGVQLYGAPCIIIDFGTAITFCFIDKNKNYRGGLILPGLPLMLIALHQGTAKLPEVEIKKPEHIIGKNTIESIQSGLYYQTIGTINYIINLLRKKYNNKSKVIMTGGLAPLFKQDINISSIMEPDLTLKGLNIIFNLK